ncbi:MAG: hypothetical protein JO024_08880 [Candidatus Eremiobacteraeota bacterium]|nr:hypothetical protein [Candidatus Eremiobacteraeota bacterium]
MLLGIIFVVSGAITPAQVYQHAHIPVLIPSVMPDWGVSRVYENVDLAKPGKYRIYFGLAPHCYAGACDGGSVTGGIQDDMAQFSRDPNRQSVKLRDGTTAMFVPFRCGASCGESVLGFWRHHVWYVVALHAARKAEMLRAANSMLPR